MGYLVSRARHASWDLVSVILLPLVRKASRPRSTYVVFGGVSGATVAALLVTPLLSVYGLARPIVKKFLATVRVAYVMMYGQTQYRPALNECHLDAADRWSVGRQLVLLGSRPDLRMKPGAPRRS